MHKQDPDITQNETYAVFMQKKNISVVFHVIQTLSYFPAHRYPSFSMEIGLDKSLHLTFNPFMHHSFLTVHGAYNFLFSSRLMIQQLYR